MDFMYFLYNKVNNDDVFIRVLMFNTKFYKEIATHLWKKLNGPSVIWFLFKLHNLNLKEEILINHV